MERSGQPVPQQGDLSWRLSSHPVTLLWFLGFRLCELLDSCPWGLGAREGRFILRVEG